MVFLRNLLSLRLRSPMARASQLDNKAKLMASFRNFLRDGTLA